MPRSLRVLPVAAMLLAAPPVLPAPAAERAGIAPEGDLVTMSRFSGRSDVRMARDSRTDPYCFYDEGGSRHRTVIGIGRGGAFLQLKNDDSAGPSPEPPLSFIAMSPSQEDEDGPGYRVIARYDGEIALTRPAPGAASATVEALGEPGPFVQVIGQAIGEYVAWVSREDPTDYTRLKIFGFSEGAADALMSCAEAQGF